MSRAKPSTPVAAINAGRVVLAQPLYYEGGCVVVDHGLGLMSVYMHLSKIEVTVGQRVRRGQIVALSGASTATTTTDSSGNYSFTSLIRNGNKI